MPSLESGGSGVVDQTDQGFTACVNNAEMDIISRFEAKKSSRVMLENALRTHLRYFDSCDTGCLDWNSFSRAFEQYSYGVAPDIMMGIFER